MRCISIWKSLRAVMLGLSLAGALCYRAQADTASLIVRKTIQLPEVPDTLMVDGQKTVVYYHPQLDENVEFPGDMAELMRFLAKNITYTQSCYQPTGRTVTRILIDRDGLIRRAETVQSLEKYIDEEILRVVCLMPLFKPAKKDGETVACWLYLPVTFRDAEQ